MNTIIICFAITSTWISHALDPAPPARRAGVDAWGHVSLWLGDPQASRASSPVLRRERAPAAALPQSSPDKTEPEKECEPTALNPSETSRKYSSSLVPKGGIKSFYRHSVLDTQSGGAAWCAGHNKEGEWLEMGLEEPTRVVGTVVQGALGPDAWVTNYEVKYSLDGKKWDAVGSRFNGSQDFNSHVKNEFEKPILAQFVRIYPRKWHTDQCMRAGLLVCKVASSQNVGEEASNSSATDSDTESLGPDQEANGEEPAPPWNESVEVVKTVHVIDCEWKEWGSWSECTRSCGHVGVRWREREVKVFPQNDGRNCEGEPTENEDCNRLPCPHDHLSHAHSHHLQASSRRRESHIVVVPVPVPIPVPEPAVAMPEPLPAAATPAPAPPPPPPAVVVVQPAYSPPATPPPAPAPAPPPVKPEDGPLER